MRWRSLPFIAICTLAGTGTAYTSAVILAACAHAPDEFELDVSCQIQAFRADDAPATLPAVELPTGLGVACGVAYLSPSFRTPPGVDHFGFVPGPEQHWVTAGLPLHSLRFESKTRFCQWHTSLHHGLFMLRGSGTRAVPIPLLPVWHGLATNSLLFAAAIAVTSLGLRAARAQWRRTHAYCPACGYSRAPRRTCSECGYGELTGAP